MNILIFNSALSLMMLLTGCSSTPDQNIPNANTVQEIKGRDDTDKRFPVYQVRVPDHWIRRDPLPQETLSDTTKAICEFIIKEDDAVIRIAIHNFPTDSIESRIPPIAQIDRWKKQFTYLSPTDTVITPQAFAGYSGLFFKGTGQSSSGKNPSSGEMMVLGWSLVLAPEHYRMLSHAPDAKQARLYREMRADVTIKAVGPIDLMEANEAAITAFARSFGLLEEIPARS